MKVSTLVEQNATITRIAEVKPGDIYKRLDKPSYGEARIVMGQITDVMNDGEGGVAVSAVEFLASTYAGGVEPTLRAFAPDTDLMIYPVAEAEWRAGLDEALKRQNDAVRTAELDLRRKTEVLHMLGHIASHGVEQPKVVTVRPDALEA